MLLLARLLGLHCPLSCFVTGSLDCSDEEASEEVPAELGGEAFSLALQPQVLTYSGDTDIRSGPADRGGRY